MKKIFTLLLPLFIITIFISGCAVSTGNTGTENQKAKGSVAATIFPLYDITRIVAGEDITVDLILPPGTSPHTFDPTPQDLKQLTETEHIFAIGHDIDTWAVDISKGVGDIPVTVVDNGITLRTFGEVHAHEDDHAHEEEADHAHEDVHGHAHEAGAKDPHYWLSPDNAVIIAHNVAHELSELYPEHADGFEARANSFAQDIASAKQQWDATLAPYDHPKIITFHDAFGYFADYFHLDVVATVEPFAGKEPTPQYIKELNETIRDTQPQGIFIEPQLSSTAVSSLAGDLSLEVGTIDPLGGTSQRDSYIDLITYNVNEIVKTIEK